MKAMCCGFKHVPVLLLDRHAGVRDFDFGMLPSLLFGFAQQSPAVLLRGLPHVLLRLLAGIPRRLRDGLITGGVP